MVAEHNNRILLLSEYYSFVSYIFIQNKATPCKIFCHVHYCHSEKLATNGICAPYVLLVFEQDPDHSLVFLYCLPMTFDKSVSL